MSDPDPNDETVVRPVAHRPGGSDPAGHPGGSEQKTVAMERPASDSAPGNVLPPGSFLGEFEITGLLGEGGFGIVYLARHRVLQQPAAVKEYLPSSLARRVDVRVELSSPENQDAFDAGLRKFMHEAQLLARFDHPSLVKVLHYWEANGTAYMAMPLIQGVTLKERLRSLGGPPDEAWLLRLLAPLTDALHTIHSGQQPCLHRDIAPDNIILREGTERPVLLDFGAARRAIHEKTQMHFVIFKRGYAPLEQQGGEEGDLQQGPWTDIYALAATVYYAIQGKTPPDALTRAGSATDPYLPLEQAAAGRYSPRFLRAIDDALRIRPTERTQDAPAFRAQLGIGAGADDEPTRLQVTGSTPRATPAPGAGNDSPASAPGATRRRLVLGATVAGVAALGLGAYLVARPPGTPPATTPGRLQTDAAPAAGASVPQGVTPPGVDGSAVKEQAAASPAVLDAASEFRKVVAQASADFSLRASAAKRVVKIGEALSISVTANRQGFLYVWVRGVDGALGLLYPNGYGTGNRVSAGQTLKLPQEGWDIVGSEPVGTEEFLVIVSASRRDLSGLGLVQDASDSKFLNFPGGTTRTPASSDPRAMPLLLGRAEQCATSACEDYGAVSFQVDLVH